MHRRTVDMDDSNAANEENVGGVGYKSRNTNYCCVPQCSRYAENGVHLHLFPKNATRRKKWEVALKMGKPATDSMKVCSVHFLPTDYFPGGM